MDVSSDNTIEVVVLFGEDRDIVKELVNKLQGTFEDLGYGFGIINIAINKLIELAKSSAIQYIELPKSLYLTDSNNQMIRKQLFNKSLLCKNSDNSFSLM